MFGDGQIYGNVGIGIPPDQSPFNPYKLKVNGPTSKWRYRHNRLEI